MAVQASFPFFCNNSLECMDGGVYVDDISQFFQQQQMQQQMIPSSYPPPLVATYSDFAYSLATQMEKQRLEVEQFLRLQTDRLRASLQHQRKQHLCSLMRMLDSKVFIVLRQMEGELAKTSKRAMELQENLKRAEEERDTWQRIAKENEAMVVSLSNTLEQVRDPCFSSTGPAEEEDAASSTAGIDRSWFCKSCKFRDSCLLFLPCRHLCSCKPCEAFLDTCPVCGAVKKGIMEVLRG